MKHQNDTESVISAESVHAALERAGIYATPRACLAIARHAVAMLRENATTNLTRIVDPEAVLALHIVDSALALPQVDAAPAGVLCDIGAGSGYPGLPLAALSGRATVLVESVKKKARFLALVAADLALEIEVVPLRSEEYALIKPESCAVVTARAVAPLSALVELAAPLLSVRGRLIALKGRVESAELAGGDAAAAVCGMKRMSLGHYELDSGGGQRALVVYEKVRGPSVGLPRRPGMARSHPLT